MGFNMANTKHIKVIKPVAKPGKTKQDLMPPGEGCIPIK